MPRIRTLIELPDGQIAGVDPRRLHEIPYNLLTNPPNNFVAIAANSSSTFTALTISGEGPLEVASLAHEKTGGCLVFMQIQDGQTQKGLMNGNVHIDTIFGSGSQPYYLPESLYIDELRSMVINFTDISGAGNQVAVNLNSGRYLSLQVDQHMERIRARLDSKQYLTNPFFYTFDQADAGGNGGVIIPAGGTIQRTITVGQADHFKLFKISGVQTSIDYDINIVDTARGESIIDAPNNTSRLIAANLCVGTANFPYYLINPRFVNLGQQLLVTLRDRSGAPNTVHLTLGGQSVADKMWGS